MAMAGTRNEHIGRRVQRSGDGILAGYFMRLSFGRFAELLFAFLGETKLQPRSRGSSGWKISVLVWCGAEVFQGKSSFNEWQNP